MSLEIGTRVMKSPKKWNPHDDTSVRGATIAPVVKDPLSGKEKVYVKWDSKWRSPNPEEVLVESLLLEEEGDKRLSELEAEYNKVAEQVSEKMSAASALVGEAATLAKTAGFNLSEMYDECYPLMRSMSSAGWSTSSMSC